jgi:predicted amidophosphoribosyltransferase
MEIRVKMFPCPVCSYGMADPPDNYNICPQCGTEFGFDDAGKTHQELREEWIKGGCKWWSKYVPKPKRDTT